MSTELSTDSGVKLKRLVFCKYLIFRKLFGDVFVIKQTHGICTMCNINDHNRV